MTKHLRSVLLFLPLLAGCVVLPPKPPVPPGPPPTVVHAEYLTVSGPSGPLADAGAWLSPDDGSGPYAAKTDQGGRASFRIQPYTHDWIGANLVVTADGYVTYEGRVSLHGPGESELEPEPAAVLTLAQLPRPPPQTRKPLAAFPAGTYDHDWWFTPPAAPNRRYLRADAWGCTVPGLPFVPGGSSEHPERALSWFLDKWSLEWQQAILDCNSVRGYTHFLLMWEDAHADGLTLEQFVEECRFVKKNLPFVEVSLGSKGITPRDETPEEYAARFDPVMDALFAAGVVDEIIPGFEWDLWNVPGPTTEAIFQHIGTKAHAAGVAVYLHFSTEKTSWPAENEGRFVFWEKLTGYVDGLDYQGDPHWSIPEYQARIADTIRDHPQFADGTFDFRDFEQDASVEFTSDTVDEDAVNLRAYLLLCTRGNAPVWGFGNGARMPDGMVIH